MGLIMLILIGTVPTAYALNRALPDSAIIRFEANSAAAAEVIEKKAAGYDVLGNPRPAVTGYVSQHRITEGTYPSLAVLVREIAEQVKGYGSLKKIPAEAVGNTRNDMYLASEALRYLMKDKDSDLSKDELAALDAYKQSLEPQRGLSRSGSRFPSRSRSDLEPWSDGSASLSPWERRSARPI
jgi:inorganic phosphate transporter, PiT family